jgi:hypothetical protein
MYYIDKRSASALSVDKSESIADFINDTGAPNLGLDVSHLNMEVQTGAVGWYPVKTQANLKENEAWLNMSIFGQDLVPKYGEIVEGHGPR